MIWRERGNAALCSPRIQLFVRSEAFHERPEVGTLTYHCIQGIYNPQLHGMRCCCTMYGSYVFVDHFNSGACYAQRSVKYIKNLAKIKKRKCKPRLKGPM